MTPSEPRSERLTARLTSFQVWPALGSALAILVLGSLPMAPPGAHDLSDKTQHALGFGAFAWLAARAARALLPAAGQNRALLAGFLASTGLGGLLELWQACLPYRSAEWLDFAADALGASIAMGLSAVLWQLLEPKAAAP